MATTALEVSPLSELERKLYPNPCVIGTICCPGCGKSVLVINDGGPHGNKRFHYLQNHYDQAERLCPVSGEMLVEV